MDAEYGLADPGSISPLPDDVHRSLGIVSAMAIISFTTTVLLFLRLCYLFIRWRKHGEQASNQILILIFNLVIADIQQAIGFMLNAHWLSINAIEVGTGMCWAQGWFISIGDLASGVFTMAIAIHAFSDIVFDLRLKTRAFVVAVCFCWVFVYFCSILGVCGNFIIKAS